MNTISKHRLENQSSLLLVYNQNWVMNIYQLICISSVLKTSWKAINNYNLLLKLNIEIIIFKFVI